jgi:hypothetical protein
LAIGSGLKELKRKGEGWTHRRSSPARWRPWWSTVARFRWWTAARK